MIALQRVLAINLFFVQYRAVRYSPKGGVVEIVVSSSEDSFLKFEVIDHGEGMDPARLEKLGKAFETGERVPEATTKGTGLGLYGTKELLTRMGSRRGVQVTSVKGQGSTFAFDLPIRPPLMSLLRITPSLTPAPSPSPSSRSSVASPNEIRFCKPLKAIFLDDERVTRHLYRMIFNRSVLDLPGNIFIDAGSGEELLENRRLLVDCDVCVFDMHMKEKGLTGLQTAAIVHVDFPNIPFVIASGDDVRKEDIFKQLGDQVTTIPKPLNRQTLITTINELVTKYPVLKIGAPAAPQKPDGS